MQSPPIRPAIGGGVGRRLAGGGWGVNEIPFDRVHIHGPNVYIQGIQGPKRTPF